MTTPRRTGPRPPRPSPAVAAQPAPSPTFPPGDRRRLSQSAGRRGWASRGMLTPADPALGGSSAGDCRCLRPRSWPRCGCRRFRGWSRRRSGPTLGSVGTPVRLVVPSLDIDAEVVPIELDRDRVLRPPDDRLRRSAGGSAARSRARRRASRSSPATRFGSATARWTTWATSSGARPSRCIGKSRGRRRQVGQGRQLPRPEGLRLLAQAGGRPRRRPVRPGLPPPSAGARHLHRLGRQGVPEQHHRLRPAGLRLSRREPRRGPAPDAAGCRGRLRDRR